MDSKLIYNDGCSPFAVLETSGCCFEMRKGDPALVRDGWAESVVSLVLNKGIQGRLEGVVARNYSPIKDILDLAEYLEMCISTGTDSSEKPIEPSYVFLPLSLAFQISPQDVDVFDDGGGYMTITIQVNVGEGSQRIYVGVQSTAELLSVKRFIKQIRAFGKSMNSGDTMLNSNKTGDD